MNYCAEIIESGLHSWKALCWNLDNIPAFGSLMVASHKGRTIFGLVYQIQTGANDPNRVPFAYKKTEEELRKEQPQIFELLKTTFACITVGYKQNNEIVYQIVPEPLQIHTFVSPATTEEQRVFFLQEHFIHLLFSMAPQIISLDELLLASITQNKLQQEQTLLMKIFEAYAILTGNDYHRLKFFLQRVQATQKQAIPHV